MHKKHKAAAFLAAVFALPGLVLAAQGPAQPGAAGVLEVEFLIDGQYSAKNELDTIDWRVKRNLKVTYEIYSRNLTPLGTISNAAHTAEAEAAAEAFSAKGEEVMANNADLMASMEAAEEACGDDDACMEQFMMRMAMQPKGRQQLNAMAKDAKGAMPQAQALQAQTSAPRYQLWQAKDQQPVKVGGEAGLEETLHSTTFDPICHETNNICTFDRARKGGHKVDGAGTELAMAGPIVEIDTVTNKISLVIPAPAVAVNVDEKTNGSAGKADVPFLGNPMAMSEVKIIDTDGRQGEKVIKLERLDYEYNAPVTVTVRWSFHGV